MAVAGERNIEDLKSLVVHTLETNGVLGSIRAQLRANVYKAIDSEEEQPGSNASGGGKLMGSQYGRLMAEIVVEFMDFYEFRHSLSVMIPECNLGRERRSRTDIAFDAGLARVLPDVSILEQLIGLATGSDSDPRKGGEGWQSSASSTTASSPPQQPLTASTRLQTSDSLASKSDCDTPPSVGDRSRVGNHTGSAAAIASAISVSVPASGGNASSGSGGYPVVAGSGAGVNNSSLNASDEMPAREEARKRPELHGLGSAGMGTAGSGGGEDGIEEVGRERGRKHLGKLPSLGGSPTGSLAGSGGKDLALPPLKAPGAAATGGAATSTEGNDKLRSPVGAAAPITKLEPTSEEVSLDESGGGSERSGISKDRKAHNRPERSPVLSAHVSGGLEPETSPAVQPSGHAEDSLLSAASDAPCGAVMASIAAKTLMENSELSGNTSGSHAGSPAGRGPARSLPRSASGSPATSAVGSPVRSRSPVASPGGSPASSASASRSLGASEIPDAEASKSYSEPGTPVGATGVAAGGVRTPSAASASFEQSPAQLGEDSANESLSVEESNGSGSLDLTGGQLKSVPADASPGAELPGNSASSLLKRAPAALLGKQSLGVADEVDEELSIEEENFSESNGSIQGFESEHESSDKF